MVARTLPFRSLAALLVGLVVAASSGFAIHDPDCHTHQSGHGDAGLHAPVWQEAHGDIHEDGHGDVRHGAADARHSAGGHLAAVPAGDDSGSDEGCTCLGFCALAGQAQLAVASVPQDLAWTVLPERESEVRSGTAARVSSPDYLTPPATGPPHLS